jgi:Mrp family chromosome partitioning ATPase
VDGVVLVVDMETATEQRVRNALRHLEAVRANVLGFVLNRDRSVEPVVYGYLEEDGASKSRASRALTR